MSNSASSNQLPTLTAREQEILALVAAGLSNRAIADQLVLSHHTVEWHIKQIFQKLDVNRRTQAVAVARSLKLLAAESPDANYIHAETRHSPRLKLPIQSTTFLGREHEIAQIDALVDDPECRLVTLMGPGGIGKTRLALEAAAHKQGKFDDGVYFVALQPLTTETNIVPAIARELGLQLRPDGRAPPQQLFDYCREKSMLLVMDNFEHLLNGVNLVLDLLSAALGIKILVTSRESLNVREEFLFSVRGLAFPDHDQAQPSQSFSAVQLFAERALQVYLHFSLTEQYANVIRICQLVDGMPLALELAASWLKTLSCEEVAAEIQQGLDILSTSLRNVPERHRSMQAVFDHSWNLLSEEEQATFQRMAVFRGGCTREAAEAVAGANMVALRGLVDKSFIHRVPHTERYDIHELLRQYGEDHLNQSPEDVARVYDRHSAYYADLLAQHRENVTNHRQLEMMEILEPDLDNIRLAWYRAINQTKIESLQKSLHTLAYFHVFRSRFLEEADAFEAAVQRLDEVDTSEPRNAALAALLSYSGWVCVRIGRYEEAEAAFLRSQMLYEGINPLLSGWGSEPLTGLSLLASLQGDYTRAEKLGLKACEVSEQRGDMWNLQLALYVSTSAFFHQGKYVEAEQVAQQAYRISEQSGDQWFRAIILNDLGSIARVLGDYAQAKQYYEKSLAIRQTFGDSQGIAAALKHLALVTMLVQDHVEAGRLYQESLALYQEIGDVGGEGDALRGLGMTSCTLSDYRGAARYFYEALMIARKIQYAPFKFSVLAGVSELLLNIGEQGRSIEILALILHHPQVDQEAKEQAKQVLTEAHDRLGFEANDKAYQAALDRGKHLNIDTVLQNLSAELAEFYESQ